MSTFGTGSTTTAGASITLRSFTGTDGQTAGTDGLVPGPAIIQEGYVLGAGGDWTLEVAAINNLLDSSERIATTAFVQNRVAQIIAGGGITLGGVQDVNLGGLSDGDFIKYNQGANEWQVHTLTIGSISDVNLAGLQAGNTIVWDAVNSEWIPGQGGGGGAANLNDLGDVTIVGGANKHFLVRNGAGQYENRLISTADLSDEANIVLTTRGATFGAFDYDFTGSNSITVPAPTQNTHATTKLYVDTQVATKQPLEATLTGLANTAPVANDLIIATGVDTFGVINTSAEVRSFLGGNGSISTLDDVHTLVGIQDGNVLAWSAANSRFEYAVPAVTYTDEEARDAAGTALVNGVHTGISFVNDDNNDRINATVSLGGFSIDALSDVDTNTNAPQNGEALVWDGANFVPGAPAGGGLTQEEVEDVVGDMVAGNVETGITVTYQDNGAGVGKLDFVVDNTVVGFLAGVQDFTGNKTFSGTLTATNDVTLTGANFVRVPAPVGVSDATTKNYVDTALGGKQDTNARLDDIAALGVANNNFIVGNGANLVLESPTDAITSLGMGVALNDILIGTGANTFGTIATTAGSRSFLASDSGVDDLSDVTLGGVALANGQTLRYDNGVWKNLQLDLGDLTGTGNIVQTTAGATFGAFAYDFSNSTSVSVPVPAQNSHAATKLYVDTEVATKQPLEATLTGLANTAPVAGDLIVGTGADTFGVIATTANARTFLTTNTGLTNLSDVTLGGVALAEGQVLRVSNDNTTLVNAVLSFDDLADTGTIVKTDAGATFGAFDYDFTGVNSITVPVPTQNTHAATKKYVDDTVQLVGNVADLDDLTDVTLGGVAKAEGQVLVISNDNATFINATLDYTDLSGTPTVGVDIQAFDDTLQSISALGTAANKYIYTTGVDTWVEGDISANARTFLNTSTGVNDLSDVLVAGVADAQVLVYDGDGVGNDNNQWKNVSLSGDITITNAGVSTIGAGKVTNAKMEKPYLDITVGANTDRLNLGEILTVEGTANEIEVVGLADVGGANAGATLTIGLPDDVTITQDLTVNRDVSITRNLEITGDLTVQGTTTTINTNTLDVEDTIIRLNKGVSAGANTNDIGLFFERGTTGDDGIFIWDEGKDYFILGTTTEDDHTQTDFGATTTPGGLQIAVLEMRDNLASSFVIQTEDDDSAYITFNTLNAGGEKVVFGKVFEAVSGSKIGNITISDGAIASDTDAINFGNDSLTTTGIADLGATTVDSLDVSNGGITNAGGISNAGAISGVSSIEGSDLDLNLTDNEATALEVRGDVKANGVQPYLTFTTTNTSEEVVFNQGGVDIDFRVEGVGQANALFVDGTNGRIGINTNTPSTPLHVNGGSKFVGSITHNTGSVAFNNDSEDFDFVIKGDSDANLFYVDASTDRIGVGKNNPSKTLDIVGDVAVSSTFDVTGKTTLAGSLDLTTGSTTGITFRSDIAADGADADQSLLRVNIGANGGVAGVNPIYKSIKWVAADDRFSVESSLKSEGNFTVGADQFTVNATNGNTSVVGTLGVGGATTINNAGGTADLIVQNNGADVLNVDVSAGTTTVSGQLKTDDLRSKTAGTGNFKVRLEDNVENALEISDATNGLSFMVFDTRDNAEVINLNQDTSFTLDATFKGETKLENTNTNGLFFNSNRAGVNSEDATLITIEGGNDKNDVVLGWDTSDNALNLNAQAQVHLQGLAGSNALTIGGALVTNATIVMTTAGAITLDGTLDSPTINTDKITNKNDTSLVVELADAEASALVIRQGANESYLTIDTTAETTTLNQATSFSSTVDITGDATLDASLKIKYIDGLTTPLILANSDRTGNGAEADAILIEVERGAEANAKIKWDETSDVFEFDKTLSAESNFQVGIDAAAPKATINSTTGNLSTDGTISATSSITTDSVLNLTTASQGAIVFNSDLGGAVNPLATDDFGLTVNRGAQTDTKLYWDESETTWQFETGNVQVQNTLVVDSDAANKVEIAAGSITTADDSGISFGADNLSTTGSITSGAVALATDDTTVATTAFVKGQKLGDFDEVDTTGFNANDQVLVWDQDNSTFKAGSALYNAENARDDVATALEGGTHTFTGADGTITFTNDDAGDVINLALGITSRNLKDVQDIAPADTQVLRYVNANNRYEPTTLGTAADVDTGLSNGNVPTITTHYHSSNTNEVGDLVITGRIIESIDYGTVDEAFDGATDWALDFGSVTDTSISSWEDYGQLVV